MKELNSKTQNLCHNEHSIDQSGRQKAVLTAHACGTLFTLLTNKKDLKKSGTKTFLCNTLSIEQTSLCERNKRFNAFNN